MDQTLEERIEPGEDAETSSDDLELELLIFASVDFLPGVVRGTLEKLKISLRQKTYILYNLVQVGAHASVCSSRTLSKGPLAVFRQELIHLREGAFPSLVAKGGQGVLEDVGCVCGADHGDGADISELEVLGEPLARR